LSLPLPAPSHSASNPLLQVDLVLGSDVFSSIIIWLLLFVVLHALVDDFEVLIKILVSGSRCSHPEKFFVVIFEYLALELVGREVRHVAQVPQVMWGVLRRLIEGEGSCVEVDTLVVVGA
jgi:hypothetical protein